MSRNANKNWKEVYMNIKRRETLQPNDDYISMSTNKVAASKRIITDDMMISNKIDSKKLPKSKLNANEQRSNVVKPKKTVNSLSNICKQFTKTPLPCNKCGNIRKIIGNGEKQKYDPNQQRNNEKKTLLRSYKNYNFNFITNSEKVDSKFKKESSLLDADSNVRTDKIQFRGSVDTVYSDLSEVESTSSEDILKEESLEKLKEFRKKNYFECHSVSKIKDKAMSTASSHKCSYRFYLNDRLFPVPICTDYNNTIRCTECHLPMKFNNKSGKITLENDENLNGTIQAKVALGDERNQDLTIILPVKETLIIPERRKNNICNLNHEKFYFGVIQLNRENCFRNKNWPTDSLALRYQKGYRESSEYERYRYKKNEEFEFISI